MEANDEPQGLASGLQQATEMVETSLRKPTGASGMQPRPKINRVRPRGLNAVRPVPRTLGQRLTHQRMRLNFTQAEVASEVTFTVKSGDTEGVPRKLSRNAYAMYELGLAEPSLRVITRLARILRVKPAWLAFGEPGAPRLSHGAKSEQTSRPSPSRRPRLRLVK